MESTTQEIMKKYEKEIDNLNKQVIFVRICFILKLEFNFLYAPI